MVPKYSKSILITSEDSCIEKPCYEFTFNIFTLPALLYYNGAGYTTYREIELVEFYYEPNNKLYTSFIDDLVVYGLVEVNTYYLNGVVSSLALPSRKKVKNAYADPLTDDAKVECVLATASRPIRIPKKCLGKDKEPKILTKWRYIALNSLKKVKYRYLRRRSRFPI